MRSYFCIIIVCLGFTNFTDAQNAKSSWTVQQVIDSIRKNVKPHWFKTKTDTIVIGNAYEMVTGIATCMFDDMNVLL